MSLIKPLLEFYAGKNKYLIEAEKEMKVIVDELRKFRDSGDRYKLSSKPTDYTKHPANKKIEELLATAFNVSSVKLHWGNGSVPNAYTLPPLIPTLYKANSAEMSNSKNKINMNIHVWLFDENVILADLNEREMIATIIHEIGHNFYFTPYIGVYHVLLSVMTLGVSTIQKGILKLAHIVSSEVSGFIKRHLPVITNLNNTLNDIYVLLFGNPMVSALLQVATLPIRIYSNMSNIGSLISGYGAEKGSDSLATKYGYGPDLITALGKMTRPEHSLYYKSIDSNKGATKDIGHIFTNMAELINLTVSTMTLEPHPSLNVRFHNIVDSLKSDLNSGQYDPEYKKDLLEQIKNMEDVYKSLNENPGTSAQLKKNISLALDEITGNKADFREILKPLQDKYKF